MLGGEAWSRNSSPGPAVVQGAVGEEIVAALASNKDITALVSSKVGVAGALVSNSAAAALNPDPCFHRAAAAAITSTPNHSDLRTSTITTVDIAATSSSSSSTTTTTTTGARPAEVCIALADEANPGWLDARRESEAAAQDAACTEVGVRARCVP